MRSKRSPNYRPKEAIVSNSRQRNILRIIALIPLIFIVLLTSQNPVQIPFVDDWILVPWLLNSENINLGNLLTLVNGHQYASMKIFLFIYGRTIGSNLFPISIIGIALLYASTVSSISLLSRKIKFNYYTYLIGVYLILTVLSFRQMQNIFMIICLPWIFSFFMIIKFAELMQDSSIKSNQIKMLILAIIASFSTGLGLILCIYAVFVFINIYAPIRIRIINIALLILAIFTSFVLPQLNFFPNNSSDQHFSQLDLLSKFHKDPIEIFKFISSLAGQPMIPWRYNLLNLSCVVGTLILLIIIWNSISEIRSLGFKKFILSNPLLIIGLIFIAVLLQTRFITLGAIGSLEPRYTTGSLVLLIGVLMQTLSKGYLRRFLYRATLSASLFGILVSSSSGLNYYLDRYLQQQSIKNCFKENINTETVHNCYDEIASYSLGVDRKDLQDYMEVFFSRTRYLQ